MDIDNKKNKIVNHASYAMLKKARENSKKGNYTNVEFKKGEHFRHVRSGKNTLKATIEVVQPTGARTYGSFGLNGTHVVAELGAHEAPLPDTPIRLSIASERTAFFDPKTGAAIGRP